MKKVIALTMLLAVSFTALSQNVSFLDIRNKEIGIIVDSQNNSFKEYYLFQYENLDLSELADGPCQIMYDKKELILKFAHKTISFSISGKSKVPGATVYSGYGLSFRKGDYVLNPKPPQTPEFIYQLISRKVGNTIQPNPVTSAIKCHSGGSGSSECSVEATVVTGGGSCSVSCRDGYYSCCDDTRNECKCIKEMVKAPKIN